MVSNLRVTIDQVSDVTYEDVAAAELHNEFNDVLAAAGTALLNEVHYVGLNRIEFFHKVSLLSKRLSGEGTEGTEFLI